MEKVTILQKRWQLKNWRPAQRRKKKSLQYMASRIINKKLRGIREFEEYLIKVYIAYCVREVMV